MTKKFTLFLLSTVLSAVFITASSQAVFAKLRIPFFGNRQINKAIVDSRINYAQSLIKKGKYKQAEKFSLTTAKLLKLYGLNKREENKYKAKIYRELIAESQAKQGYYDKAANSIRQANQYVANSSDVKQIVDYSIKSRKQTEKFNLVKKHYKKIIELYKEKLPILKTKNKLVNKMLRKKRITKNELKDYQQQLRKIDRVLAKIRNKVKAENKIYLKKLRQFGNVTFTKSQINKRRALAKKRFSLAFSAYKEQAKIAKGLSMVTQKYKYSWDNLSDNFKKLSKLQNNILGLKKEILSVLNTKNLTEKDLKTLKKLRNKLKSLLKQANKLYRNVEKGFLDAKHFNRLSSKEQKAFQNMFVKVWRQQKRIYKEKPTVRELYYRINKALQSSVAKPISKYEKMMIKALFGKTPVKVEKPKKGIMGGINKYYDEKGNLICIYSPSLGPKYAWKDANNTPIKTPHTSPIQVNPQNTANMNELSNKFNAFPSFKVKVYEITKNNSIIIKTSYFAKNGEYIGRSETTFSPYPRTRYFDRNGKAIKIPIKIRRPYKKQDIKTQEPKNIPPVSSQPATYTDNIPGTNNDNNKDFGSVATYTDNLPSNNNGDKIEEDTNRAGTNGIDNKNSSSTNTNQNSNLLDSF